MPNNWRTNLALWRWQRWSALLLLPLLTFHVSYQYFYLGTESITFETVSGRLQLTLLVVLDVLLLAAATVHAFTGMRSIAIDHTSSPAGIRAITAGIGLAFTATVAYAIAALIFFL